jgi:uncharacterized protein YbcI
VLIVEEGFEGEMDSQPVPESAETADYQSSVRAELSREMVRLYKEQFGRGPTKARTEFAGPDVVVCTLEDSFTPAERRLAEMEEHQRLRDTRLYFQHATKGDFIAVVEKIVGRKVRAFNSSIDTHEDVSVEVFHLVPGDPGNHDYLEVDRGEQLSQRLP